MLCLCVVDVMDVVFSFCIVRCSCMGSVSVSSCRCCMCASCGNSQCCVLHDLQFGNAGRGCKRRPYGRGILQSRMCVLHVRCVSKVRPRTFGCVGMRSAVLFIFRSSLLLYSTGSGVNRVQVVCLDLA